MTAPIRVLDSGTSGATQSLASRSVLATAGKVVYALVENSHASSAVVPSASGGGLTFAEALTVVAGSRNRLTLLKAPATSPTAGPVTFTFGGSGNAGASYVLFAAAADVTVQMLQPDTATGKASRSVGPSLAFGPFADPVNNQGVIAVMHVAGEAVSFGAGWSPIADLQHSGVGLAAAYCTGTPPPIVASWATAAGYAALSFEIPAVAAAVTYDVTGDRTINGNLVIPAGYTFAFDPNVSATLTVKGHLELRGRLWMHPADVTKVQTIIVQNDSAESTYIGGGDPTSPVPTDIGVWVFGRGQFDCIGTERTHMDHATASLSATGTSVTLLGGAPTGWQTGDILAICPTEDPGVDQHWRHFDDLQITGIAGAVVSFARWDGTQQVAGGLRYDHPLVTYFSQVAGTPVAAVGAAGNVDVGTHTYKITELTSDGESDASAASNQITISSAAKHVSVTLPPAGPKVTGYNVYRRIAGDTGNYKLVNPAPIAKVATGVSQTYDDNVADASLGATTAPATNTSGLTWGAEVMNLTRNWEIRGKDANHRVHIFVTNDGTLTNPVKHVMSYGSLRWMGPRKNGLFVKGRYFLHFHHDGDAVAGSFIQGMVCRDGGSHVYVSHNSDAITYDHCISYNTQEEPYWWDPVEQIPGTNPPQLTAAPTTENVVYADCIAAKVLPGDPTQVEQLSGFLLIGEASNRALRCIAVGIDGGKASAGYLWSEKNAAVWGMDSNTSHNNAGYGSRVWQNPAGEQIHVINDLIVFRNDRAGILHGAYVGNYRYVRPIAFDNGAGSLELHALSKGITQGVDQLEFSDFVFDVNGEADFAVFTNEHSAIAQRGLFARGEFKNPNRAGMGFTDPNSDSRHGPEYYDVRECVWTSCPQEFFLATTIPATSSIRVHGALPSGIGDGSIELRPASASGGTARSQWGNCKSFDIADF